MSKFQSSLIIGLVFAICCLSLAAQSTGPAAKKPAAAATIKRMPDGHPDFEGMYDLATLTPLERPAGAKAVLTEAEAAALEKGAAALKGFGDQPVKGDRSAPPLGGDGSTGAAGNVGGYNSFWLDPGSSYTVVNGEHRTSIIVDPPDGRVPALTPEARARAAANR